VSYEKLEDLMDNRSLRDYYKTEYEENDFIIRNIIKQVYDDGKVVYELSLFGVMLCIILTYHNTTGKLTCGLYYKEFSFEEYCNIIVSNYRMKLPLIFGKWNLLTEALKRLAIYNFILLLHKAETSSIDTNFNSVMLGGNKELCDGVRTIFSYNAKLMKDFIYAFEEFLANEKRSGKKTSVSDREKLGSVTNKFMEVVRLLSHIDQTRLVTKLSEKSELSFADEITALYYMNFNSKIPLSTIIPRDHSLFSEHSEMLNRSPREYLSLILQHDKGKPSLKEWFSSWMNDLTGLQQEISENTKQMAIA
jgi:hypothetical protein